MVSPDEDFLRASAVSPPSRLLGPLAAELLLVSPSMKRRVAVLAAVTLVHGTGLGTTRVAQHARPYAICVPKGDVCALVGSGFHRTTVIRTSARGSEILWSIPFSSSMAYFSPDGRFLVFTGEAKQRLASWHGRGTALITFWGAGGVVSTVRFEDLFPLLVDPKTRRMRLDHSEMRRENPDWFYWGDFRGFNSRGQFEVSMVRGGVIKIDPSSGKAVT